MNRRTATHRQLSRGNEGNDMKKPNKRNESKLKRDGERRNLREKNRRRKLDGHEQMTTKQRAARRERIACSMGKKEKV